MAQPTITMLSLLADDADELGTLDAGFAEQPRVASAASGVAGSIGLDGADSFSFLPLLIEDRSDERPQRIAG